MQCKEPIPFETLAAYWLGELAAAESDALEEHVFACAHCSRRLEGLAALAEGTRDAVRDGRVGLVVSTRFIEAMKQSGLRLSEYRLAPGGSANCTLARDKDAVVTRMGVPLAGVKRVDLVQRQVLGGVAQPEVRMADVPFDPAAGEVVSLPAAAVVRRQPSYVMQLRLVAVDEAGERTLGEYTLNHTAAV